VAKGSSCAGLQCEITRPQVAQLKMRQSGDFMTENSLKALVVLREVST